MKMNKLTEYFLNAKKGDPYALALRRLVLLYNEQVIIPENPCIKLAVPKWFDKKTVIAANRAAFGYSRTGQLRSIRTSNADADGHTREIDISFISWLFGSVRSANASDIFLMSFLELMLSRKIADSVIESFSSDIGYLKKSPAFRRNIITSADTETFMLCNIIKFIHSRAYTDSSFLPLFPTVANVVNFARHYGRIERRPAPCSLVFDYANNGMLRPVGIILVSDQIITVRNNCIAFVKHKPGKRIMYINTLPTTMASKSTPSYNID